LTRKGSKKIAVVVAAAFAISCSVASAGAVFLGSVVRGSDV
jgi:hypothetical protein